MSTVNCSGLAGGWKEVTVRQAPLMEMESPSWTSFKREDGEEIVNVMVPPATGLSLMEEIAGGRVG